MVRYVNATAVIGGCWLMYQAILQAMQLGNWATLLSLIRNFAMLFAFTVLRYYTDQHDGARIVWSYPLTYTTIAVAGPFFLYAPLKKVWDLRKEEKVDGNELEDVLVGAERPDVVEESQP
jgi:hypothetical protein